MKKWKCTVCGYIHKGEDPPETCPVCGADKSKFVEIKEDVAETPKEEKAAAPTEGGAERKWRCTVCGYIHTGPEPPDKCPVCGADKTKFVEVTDDRPRPEPPPSPRPPAPPQTPARRAYDRLTDAMVRLHAHPISVHVPNGVAPVAVFFLLLALAFDAPALERAAFYNMVVVLLAMPAVLFSGYNDWQKRFGGNMTRVFLGKMICGAVVSLMALIAVVWRMINPEIALGDSGALGYTLVHLILLGAGAFAGFLGGKLVFNQS